MEQEDSMGFYLRKSVSVGPFRVNFSSSGVGISAGIKGLRVGTGPRGNYISVGTGALRYRATLPRALPSSRSVASTINLSDGGPDPRFSSDGVNGMTAIESGPIETMQDNSSSDLLKELRGKAQRPAYWKFSAVASVLAVWLCAQSSTALLMWLVGVAGLGLTIYIDIRDTVAKTAVLCYQLDEPNEKAFDSLHNAFAGVSSCSKAWRIDAKGAVKDSKYHAGASALVTRKGASFGRGLPPMMKCNIEVPFVKGNGISLYFMPDRVLVYSSADIGAVAYKELMFDGHVQRFIEDGGVPHDAEVVDKTWKYVNKKGGPDKRFKDNRQLPVVLYEELRFGSASGLNEVFQVSKHSTSAAVRNAFSTMKSVLPV
jgi:hypothetical protein